MQISSFNVNTKTKFRKNKLVKGIAALGLTSIVATSFASCDEKEPLFKDTILEKVVVAEVDGNVEILRNEHVDNKGTHRVFKDVQGHSIHHDHYVNIVTGEWLANGNNVCESFRHGGDTIHPRNVKINNISSIDNYLTRDEYNKAISGQFTNSDVIEVFIRIKNVEKEQSKVKEK